MATWNKLNIDAAALSTGSTGTLNKSMFMGAYPPGGATPRPLAAIYGGGDSTILDNTVTNSGKVFFSSDFDYLRIKRIVDFTITLPARNRRSTGGGKKSGSGFLSYNGYADHYIFQHDYGSPPPAFTVFIKPDASNGAVANHGITGSIPLQFLSSSSFRLGLTYSTDKYLVLRERYQVYSNDLPQLTLTVRAHFFENPTTVTSAGSLTVVHSPSTFDTLNNSPYVWTGGAPPAGYGAPRYIYTLVNFTSQLSRTFNRVKIDRTGGIPSNWVSGASSGHFINQIKGVAVTPFDPYTTTAQYDYPTQQNTWSMQVSSYTTARNAAFTPTWKVEFINTITGESYADYVGGIHRFTG